MSPLDILYTLSMFVVIFKMTTDKLDFKTKREQSTVQYATLNIIIPALVLQGLIAVLVIMYGYVTIVSDVVRVLTFVYTIVRINYYLDPKAGNIIVVRFEAGEFGVGDRIFYNRQEAIDFINFVEREHVLRLISVVLKSRT